MDKFCPKCKQWFDTCLATMVMCAPCILRQETIDAIEKSNAELKKILPKLVDASFDVTPKVIVPPQPAVTTEQADSSKKDKPRKFKGESWNADIALATAMEGKDAKNS